MKEDAPIYFFNNGKTVSTGPNTNTSWPGGRKVRDVVERILGLAGATLCLTSVASLQRRCLKLPVNARLCGTRRFVVTAKMCLTFKSKRKYWPVSGARRGSQEASGLADLI